jgi:excisionase family DNA binding protein
MNQPNSAPMLLKVPEAARCLGICERTLFELTRRSEIPCVRIGRAVRYDPRDLDRWIEAQKLRCGHDSLENLQEPPYT